MARDPRIMHVEERDGKHHILSDEELDQRYALQRVIFRLFFVASLIFGPGLMGLVALFSDYSPSYLGAFVIANAITTALAIVVKYPDYTGETVLKGTIFFVIFGIVFLLGIEWLVGYFVPAFEIPFFWVLAGILPFGMNWKTARSLNVV